MTILIPQEAIEHIKKVDPQLGSYIDLYGPIHVTKNPNVFETIVSSIISQQLSLKAAQTIERRFLEAVKAYEPSMILLVPNDLLRACGLSERKVSYIKELSQKVEDGTLRLDDIDSLDDEQIIERLMSVKGIGRWTAEMLAIFSLGRADIFPYDDLAVKKAVMKVHGYQTFSPHRYALLKKRYAPYGTTATLYYYEVKNQEHL